MASDKSSGMKSAYEAALEKLEQQGIERPREDSLSEATRQEMAEVRRRADAKLAELEILYRDKKKKGLDPKTEEEYRIDRRRIEDDRDRKLDKLRHGE